MDIDTADDSVAQKACTRCRVVQPRSLEYFGRNPRMRDRLNSHCRSCVREWARNKQRARRADPVERLKLLEEKRRYAMSPKGREWKRRVSETDNHKRRQRRLAAPWNWSPTLWEKCKAAWAGHCAYCWKSNVVLTQDHFIPLALDCPGTVPANMVPACRHCNGSKGARMPWDWCRDNAVLARIAEYLISVQRVTPGSTPTSTRSPTSASASSAAG